MKTQNIYKENCMLKEYFVFGYWGCIFSFAKRQKTKKFEFVLWTSGEMSDLLLSFHRKLDRKLFLSLNFKSRTAKRLLFKLRSPPKPHKYAIKYPFSVRIAIYIWNNIKHINVYKITNIFKRKSKNLSFKHSYEKI